MFKKIGYMVLAISCIDHSVGDVVYIMPHFPRLSDPGAEVSCILYTGTEMRARLNRRSQGKLSSLYKVRWGDS